jgi:Ca2+-binding EF-hand superfamily protein
MVRSTRFAALAAISLAASPLCLAAKSDAHADRAREQIQQADANGDGRVSLDEFVAAAGAHFAAIDVRHKGAVEAADIASSPAALERIDHRAARMVARLDVAGAGYVTQDEFVAAAQKRFARLDRNDDGRLAPDELVGRGHHRHGKPAAGRASGAAQQRLERLDTNHDGVVSADEYVADARALYATFDTQHDGKVTAAELASSPRAEERAVRVAERLVQRMDSDANDVVSQDEFLAAARLRFARLDRNGDGFLDGEDVLRRHGRRHRI